MKTEPSEINIKTTLVSRNITIKGRRTSVRLELEMWRALKEISDREKCSIHDICTLIKMRKNPMTSLTAGIRVFLMLYFRASSTEEGHKVAGHGSFQNMMARARVGEEEMAYFATQKLLKIKAQQTFSAQLSYQNENYAMNNA
jgi:predicted DNA-binding ribbon-helix-helix protein